MNKQRFSANKRRFSYFPNKPFPLLSQIKNQNVNVKSATPIYNNNKDNNISVENNAKHQPEKKCNIKSRCSVKFYTGESDVDQEFPPVISISSSRHVLTEEINIPSISTLPSPNRSIFNNIFIEKIKICNYIFNFSQPQIQLIGKTEKKKALTEINSLLTNKLDAMLISSDQKDLILDMIIKNVFEQDPFTSAEKIFSSTIESTFVESSWEHMSIVYKILNQFVLLFPEKCGIDLLRKGIRLMNIPDSNENDNLVIFIKNYTKVHPDQYDEIWKHLKSALNNARYDIYTSFCINPIISCITIIFLSNKTKVIEILYTHLLPLFRHERLYIYYDKLIDLVNRLINNNIIHQLNVIQYLIKHFPYQCGKKQPLFSATLITITSSMLSRQLNPIATKLFTFIAMCIQSPNSKLAESGLSFFMKKSMRPIIGSNFDFAISILYDPLNWASSYYWDKHVREQSRIALSLLTNARFDNVRKNDWRKTLNPSDVKTLYSKNASNKDIARTWAFFSRIAARSDRNFDLNKFLSILKATFPIKEKEDEESNHPEVFSFYKK